MRKIQQAFVCATIALASAHTAQAITLPVVTSATKTLHFDASNLNNDGGLTNPASGTDIATWTNLVGGQNLVSNTPIDGAPTYISAGIGGQPTVRFSSTNAGGDLMFNNAIQANAQTIYAVATLKDNGGALSTMFSNASASLNVRESTVSGPAYFSGNAGDFINNNGTFDINGNKRFTIPGGFDAPHVIKATRDAAINYNGFRFSDNIAPDRRWNGDISEVIMFNSKLSGDDALKVQSYITTKYGIAFNAQFDEKLTDTKQLALNPFSDGTGKKVGVNFHYGPTGTVAGTFQGIGFDNIDLAGGTPPTGPFNLTANASGVGVTLALNFPFTEDNTVRTQIANITGTDAAVLNGVANHMFYVSGAGRGHDSATMLFSGLDRNQRVFVQVLGGDNGWNGLGQVNANGTLIDWLGASDGVTNSSASLLGFFALTDGNGQLSLRFSVPVSSGSPFFGIGGITILSAAVPEPASATMGLIALAALATRRRRNA